MKSAILFFYCAKLESQLKVKIKALYIYIILCLSVCQYASNKRQNGWTDGPKFCVGPHMTPGKVYECSKSQKFASKSFWFLLNFENAGKILWNPWICLGSSFICSQEKIEHYIIFENKVIWEFNIFIYISIDNSIKRIKYSIRVYGCQKLCKTCWHRN